MTSYANINIIHLTEPGQVELAYSVRYKVYVCEQGYATNTVTDELVFFFVKQKRHKLTILLR